MLFAACCVQEGRCCKGARLQGSNDIRGICGHYLLVVLARIFVFNTTKMSKRKSGECGCSVWNVCFGMAFGWIDLMMCC